jgi:hypothetical protein
MHKVLKDVSNTAVAFVATECTKSRGDFLYLKHLSCLCQRIKDWYFSIEL